MAFKQKKRLTKPKNKYLKPGALAQICNNRTTNRSCSGRGMKMIVLESETGKVDLLQQERVIANSSTRLTSPIKLSFWSTPKVINQQKQLGTPKTPQDINCNSQSRLESLPLDLLVKILCHLNHDQLKAVFHVSQQIRTAVLLAKQLHFNYITPDRSRQDLLVTDKTLYQTEHWPFLSGDWKDILSPRTPQAPRHLIRYPRIQMMDMKQIAAVLFQESVLSPRLLMPTRLLRPACNPVGSPRILFYEDELCQAVAQHKLR